MNFELDFRSGIPIYIQVVEHFRQGVLRGDLKPGDQLPTVRSLALDLRVNFNTIARAYRLLDEAGIISTQQGRGTYILALPSPEVTRELRRKSLRSLVFQHLLDASRLGAPPDEILIIMQEQAAHWKQTGSLINPESETELEPEQEKKGESL
jgi:GntR family transcriptional regulator